MVRFLKIYSKLATFLVVVLICILAIIVIPPFMGIKTYVVQSPSMEPVIHVGSIVYVDTHNRIPDIGDIATYHIESDSGETVVTHRVKDITEDGEYVFQGDANDIEDGNLVSPKQILGIYRFSIPGLGFLFGLRSPESIRIILIGIILALTIPSLFVSNLADKKEVV